MSEQDIKEIIGRIKNIEIRLTIIEEKIDYLDKYKDVLLKNND